MKITIGQAENAISQYVSKEICPKLGDWRKWCIPVFLGALIPKLEKQIYDNKDTFVAAGFMDNDNMIELDLLYDKFHRTAEESGDITQDVPMLGTLRLSSRDIETFYRIACTVPDIGTSAFSNNSFQTSTGRGF